MLSQAPLQYKKWNWSKEWAADSSRLEQLPGGPYWKCPSAQALEGNLQLKKQYQPISHQPTEEGNYS